MQEKMQKNILAQKKKHELFAQFKIFLYLCARN